MSNYYLLLEDGGKIYIEDVSGYLILEAGYIRLTVAVSDALANWLATHDSAPDSVALSDVAVGRVVISDGVI